MSDRLARFRSFMASLNATDPASAVEKGLYVPTPGTVAAERLVARLQLQPAATLAIVGGIGSGKTTQLLVARDKLFREGDILPVYLDVAAEHNIAKLEAGVLVVLLGNALGKRIRNTDKDVATAKAQFDRWAHGYTYEVEVPRSFDPFSQPQPPEELLDKLQELVDKASRAPRRQVSVPGRVAPRKPLQPFVLETLGSLARLRQAMVSEGSGKQSLVLLVDSLDRVLDSAQWLAVVEQDLRAIASVGIGVVMAAPLRSLYGVWRTTLDHFETFEYLPPVDIEDEMGLAFLGQVLQARVPEDGFEATARTALAKLSGGVLRDLLQLARLAAEEAYLSGAERIEEAHVKTAADIFGRKHIFGVTPAELATLQRLQRFQEFVPTSDDDLALLMTRRVLEYQRGRVEYAVHPTLAPLLEQLAHAA